MGSKSRRIMGIDPGSLTTGVGVIQVVGRNVRLVTAERLTARRDLDYWERMDDICDGLFAVVSEWGPVDEVAIEVPGKTHPGKQRGHTLAVYGYAVGRLEGYVQQRVLASNIHRVPVNRVPKKRRQALVKAAFPTYDASRDPGMDVSDALYLALTLEEKP